MGDRAVELEFDFERLKSVPTNGVSCFGISYPKTRNDTMMVIQFL